MATKYIKNEKLNFAYAKNFNLIKPLNFYPIHDVVLLESGDNLPKNKMKDGSIKVYGGGGKTENYHSDYNIDSKTIGIGRVGARCGCVFEIKEKSWVTDNALYIKSYDEKFDISFLKHFLRYSNLNQYANNAMQPVISKTRIKNVLIPFIDISEQRELALFFDNLEFNLKQPKRFNYLLNEINFIDDAKLLTQEIINQNELLKKLRQAILQEAIKGKLTADWRKENPNVEPASELLKRIQAEKEKLIAEKKIKKQKPLPAIKDEEIPFELPKGWVWCRLGETGLFERGKSKHRPRNDQSLFEGGIYPFVQTGDIAQSKRSNYLIESYHKLYNKKGLAQSKLWKNGTLCITIAANIAEVGILNINACIPDSVVGFTSLSDKVISHYVKHFITVTRDEIEKFAPATAQKNINLGIINGLLIPLPPLSEQKAIVTKVEKLLAYCDELEQQINQSKTYSEQLMQTVLKEAFAPRLGDEK